MEIKPPGFCSTAADIFTFRPSSNVWLFGLEGTCPRCGSRLAAEPYSTADTLACTCGLLTLQAYEQGYGSGKICKGLSECWKGMESCIGGMEYRVKLTY